MEVQHKTIVKIEPNKYGEYKRYEYKVVNSLEITSGRSSCCKEMSKEWTDLITLEDDKSPYDKPEICISYEEYDGYNDGERATKQISYCPWCGEKITFKEVERVTKIRVEKQVTEVKTVIEYEEVKEVVGG